MEKKLSKKELEKIIRKKISEHEYLTHYRGNYDELGEDERKKAESLYKEIEKLVQMYK